MIVVFGSLNMDILMRVERLPRPGETVLCPSYALKPGGKGGNQAVAAARAGGTVFFYGKVGPDDFGTRLIQALNENGVGTEGVQRGDHPTGAATISVDARGENAIAVASGANLDVRAAQVPDSALTPRTTVVMQLEVPAAENVELIERAAARGCRTILNIAPAGDVPRRTLERLDFLVVNEGEAQALARRLELGDGLPAARTARALAALVRQACIVTLGGRGVVAATRDALWEVDALPIEPVDTTGAGDAFAGVLAAGLDAGLGLPDALRRASVGAALACLALGAQESLPYAPEIEARLGELAPPRNAQAMAKN